jgi:hypothetical protein
MPEIHGFERFINSTFGLPQQLLMRLLRIAQDEDVDFFSEKGILDASLIPIAGIFDKDRQDVQGKEMVERVNKLTPDALDMDPDSFWAQLGTGIATDPLTFLGGGLTKLGRGASALNKAKKTKAGAAALGALGDAPTLNKSREALEGALNTTMKSKERRIINKALGRLKNEAFSEKGEETLGAIGKLASDRELRISAPFFNMAGKGIFKTQEYSNWMSLVGKNIPGLSPAASAIGKTLAKVPVVRDVFHSLGGIPAGWKVSGLSSLTVGGGEVAPDVLDGILSGMGAKLNVRFDTKDVTKLLDNYGASVERGATREKAFVRHIMGRKVGEDEIAGLAEEGMAVMGIKSLDDVTPEAIDAFKEGHNQGMSDLIANSSNLEINQVVGKARTEFGDTLGFKFGKKFRDSTRKFFDSETSVRSTAAGEKLGRTTVARAVETIQGRGKLMHEATMQDAAKLGLTPPEAEQFFMMRLQGDALEAEIAETSRLVGLTGDVNGFADARNNLALRLTRLHDLASVFAKDRPAMKEMSNAYKSMAEAIGSGSKYKAFYDEAGQFKLVGDVPALGGSRINQRTVIAGRSGVGVHAGNLSDDQLRTIVGRHRKNGSVAPTEAAHQAAVDSISTLAHLQKAFPTVAEDAVGFMREFELTGDEVLHNLKRARSKGGLKMLTRLKSSGQGIAPGRIKLTPQQVEQWEAAAKDFNPKATPTFDIKRLTRAQRDEMRDLETLIELRNTGKEAKMAKPHASITTVDKPAGRVANSIWAENPPAFKGAESELSSLPDGAEAIARLHFGAAELKRAGVPTPALLDDINSAAIEASHAFTKPIDEMLDAAGATSFRTLAHEMRMDILNESLEFGLMSAGSPLAYVGHIIGRDGTKAIEELLGRKEVRTILEDAMPQLSSGFARNLDAMPIEDINVAYNVLASAGNPAAEKLAGELAAIAAEKGLKLGRFETSPAQALLSRLAQGETRYAIAESAEMMLQAATDAKQIISGRVVKVLRGGGKRVAEELSQLNAKVRNTKGHTADLAVDAIANDQRMSGIVVRQSDGVHRFIPFNAVGNKGGLLPLGGKGELHAALNAGVEHSAAIDNILNDVKTSDAFALRASRGKFSQNEILETLTDAQISQLQDQHVIFGDVDVVGGMFNATQKQWEHTGEMGAMIDNATFLVKRFQTVYRPGFHLVNAAGAFFQARVLGVGVKAASAGMMDAMRFMHGDPKFAAVYDQMALHTSSADGLTGLIKTRAKGVPNLEFLRVIRRAGREGVDGAVSAEDLAKFGLQPEDLIFRAGGQEHNIGEILDVMAREGLFATFTNNGLRGSSSTSEALFKLRAGVLDPKSKAGTFFEGLDSATEASEAFARLSVTFAQLREGVDLEHAVINAKRATVDYAQLTSSEQGLKRFINFYTFPRHYIPVAAKHFAEDPAALSRISNFIKAGKATGITSEENGSVTLNIDAMVKAATGLESKTGVGFSASRVNPTMEVAKYIEAFGEIMLNRADDVSNLVGAGGVSAARQEQMSGQTNSPFGFGSLVNAGIEMVTGGNPIKEVSDAFWLSRIAFAPDDPLGEQTMMTRMLDGVLLGTKTSQPEHQKKLIEFRYKKLIADIRKKAEATTDPEYRNQLALEGQRLQAIAAQRAAQIRK